MSQPFGHSEKNRGCVPHTERSAGGYTPTGKPIDGRRGHRGFFNAKDHEKNSEIVGDLLEDWLDESIRGRLGVYKDHAFFAISALGGNPDEKGDLRHTPQPVRVADPFLWMLWKKGFINDKK